MPQTEPQSEPEQQSPAITARGIRMHGPWGPVYGPLDLDIDAGGVSVLVMPAGTSRTALLLTLAGRMKPATGEVSVFGKTRARDIFACSALACVDELDAIVESVTVGDVLTEQLRWDAPWYRIVGRAGDADLARVCVPVFGEVPLPSLSAYFDELSELEQVLLRIALANTASPPLLVVANLDHITDDGNRETVLSRLIALGERQTVITATVNGVPEGTVHAQLIVESE